MPKTSTHALSSSSMQLSSWWKTLERVAEVRCWRPPVTGRQFIAYLLI